MADKPNPNCQSQDLIEIGRAQGWDGTKIVDFKTGTTEDISGWDKPMFVWDKGLGNIPTNDPPKTFYGTDPSAIDPTGGPKMSEEITFNHPDVSREARVSGKPKMTLSNPDPGDPGSY